MRFRHSIISALLVAGIALPLSVGAMSMQTMQTWPTWIGRLGTTMQAGASSKTMMMQPGMLPASISMSLFRTTKYQLMLRSKGGSVGASMTPSAAKTAMKVMSTEGWPMWIGRIR